MGYSTIAQVQTAVGGADRLLKLSDQAKNNTLDLTVVQAAIDEADGEINSYCAKRYGIPIRGSDGVVLDPPPPLISAKSASWAARVLRRNNYNGQPMQDDLEREATDRKWLEGVANGTISIGIDPPPQKSSIVIDGAHERDSTRTVTINNLRGVGW